MDEIVGCIGDLEPLSIANSSLFEQGSSTQPSRRSAALRALHSFTSSPSVTPSASMIQSITRNRKQRFTKLREMMVDTDTEMQAKKKKRKRAGVVQVVCPVCLVNVEGDEDVVDAHVESCLAGALEQGREREREIERERERELESHRQELEADLDVDGDDSRGGYVGSVQGTGFHTRRRDDVDVEDDIDIDGDDAALFGAAQFGEQDIVRGVGEEVDDDGTVEIEDTDEPLVAIIQNLQPVPVEVVGLSMIFIAFTNCIHSLRQLSYAAYAWILTRIPPFPQVVGIHAVENVGYGVLGAPSYVQFARESQGLQNYAGFICNKSIFAAIPWPIILLSS